MVMSNILRAGLALAFLAHIESSWSADVTMSDLLKWKARAEQNAAERARLKSYLDGLNEGIGWTYAIALRDGKATLYCQPANLPLSGEVLGSMAVNARARYPSDATVANVILRELQTAFPCKS